MYLLLNKRILLNNESVDYFDMCKPTLSILIVFKTGKELFIQYDKESDLERDLMILFQKMPVL